MIEDSLEKNVVEFHDLIYDDDQPNMWKRVNTLGRVINAMSGKMISGNIYFALSNLSETKDAFSNMFSGRIPKHVKTYGTILYNGKERHWIEWSRQFRVLDISKALNYLSFEEYLEREVGFHHPGINKQDKRNMVDKLITDIENITGSKINSEEWNCYEALVVMHVLLAPEILLINNFFMSPLSSSVFIKSFLQDFVREKNSIVILNDDLLDEDMYKAVFETYYGWGTAMHICSGILVYQGRTEEYKNHIYNLGAVDDVNATSIENDVIANSLENDANATSIETDAMETSLENDADSITAETEVVERAFTIIVEQHNEKISKLNLTNEITACNNVDVTIDDMNFDDIKFIMKKRLQMMRSKYIIFMFVLVVSVYSLSLQLLPAYKSKVAEFYHNLGDIALDIKSSSGKESFYVAILSYSQFFAAVVPIVSVIFSFEIFTTLDYSEEFVMGAVSPYSYLFATFFTYNLPGYILNGTLVMLSYWIIYHKYINLTTALYAVLISFIYCFFLSSVFRFLIFVVQDWLTSINRRFRSFCNGWNFLGSVGLIGPYLPIYFYSAGISSLTFVTMVRLLRIFTGINFFVFFLIDPYFLFTTVLEVACLRHALISKTLNFYRKLYIATKPDLLDALNEFYDSPNGYSRLQFLDYDNLHPEVIYFLVKLPPSTLKVALVLGLSTSLYIILVFLYVRKQLVPNVRLRLMKQDNK